VHPLIKLIPVAAAAYLLMPADIIPDVIPVLGQVDDVVILMLGLRLFFEFAPPAVVQEHLRRLVQRVQNVPSDWSVVDNGPGSDQPPSGGDIVDDGSNLG
jgi:uncharacterized membrane protein YkvA (DUF1232 family)